MLEDGRCHIRELHQTGLPGRARLQRAGPEVWPGDGDHAKAFGGSGVCEAHQPDIRPGGRDLQDGGNPGLDGRDLLGPGGGGAQLVLGVHVGRIADRADVYQCHGASRQGCRQYRLVILLVLDDHATGPGGAQCGAGADGLNASTVRGDLIAEHADLGVEPAGTCCRAVLVPVRHLAGDHLAGQGSAGGLDPVGAPAPARPVDRVGRLLSGGEGQPPVDRAGVGVNRADRQGGGCPVPQQRPQRRRGPC